MIFHRTSNSRSGSCPQELPKQQGFRGPRATNTRAGTKALEIAKFHASWVKRPQAPEHGGTEQHLLPAGSQQLPAEFGAFIPCAGTPCSEQTRVGPWLVLNRCLQIACPRNPPLPVTARGRGPRIRGVDFPSLSLSWAALCGNRPGHSSQCSPRETLELQEPPPLPCFSWLWECENGTLPTPNRSSLLLSGLSSEAPLTACVCAGQTDRQSCPAPCSHAGCRPWP